MAYNTEKTQIKKEVSNEILKNEYNAKNDFLNAYYLHSELSTFQFLEEIFIEAINKDLMMLDNELNSNKANGQIFMYSPSKSRYKNKNGEFATYREKLILTQDNIYDIDIEGYNDVLLSTNLHFGLGGKKGLTYFLNFDIDLDKVYTAKQLMKLNNMFEEEKILKPTILVNSGTGVHLIYRLKNPINVYKKASLQVFLASVKDAICSKINQLLFGKKVIDALALDQKIRCISSTTKLGEMANSLEEAKKDIVRAWKLNDSFDLNEIINDVKDYLDKETLDTFEKIKNNSYDTFEEKPVKRYFKYGDKIYSRMNKNLYNGWFKKCKMVEEGKRYYALLGLAACAVKCGVEEDELSKNLNELKDYYNNRDTSKIKNKDIASILTSFKNNKTELLNFKGTIMNKRCGLTAKPVKRNYKTRAEHLKSIKGLGGRKSKKDEVLAFLTMQKNKGVDIKKLSLREMEEMSGIAKSTIAKYKQECIDFLYCISNLKEDSKQSILNNNEQMVSKNLEINNFNENCPFSIAILCYPCIDISKVPS